MDWNGIRWWPCNASIHHRQGQLSSTDWRRNNRCIYYWLLHWCSRICCSCSLVLILSETEEIPSAAFSGGVQWSRVEARPPAERLSWLWWRWWLRGRQWHRPRDLRWSKSIPLLLEESSKTSHVISVSAVNFLRSDFYISWIFHWLEFTCKIVGFWKPHFNILQSTVKQRIRIREYKYGCQVAGLYDGLPYLSCCHYALQQ